MENRLKNIFWPAIENTTDVDSLGTQGFWVCAVIGTLSLGALLISGQPIIGIALFLLFFLGAVGVREQSRYAAVIVFVIYFLDGLTTPSILHWLLLGLLLSNVRATWLAATWKPESQEAAPVPRFNDTWTDKLADQLPPWLWPKVRTFYYFFSAIFLALTVVGLITLYERRLIH